MTFIKSGLCDLPTSPLPSSSSSGRGMGIAVDLTLLPPPLTMPNLARILPLLFLNPFLHFDRFASAKTSGFGPGFPRTQPRSRSPSSVVFQLGRGGAGESDVPRASTDEGRDGDDRIKILVERLSGIVSKDGELGACRGGGVDIIVGSSEEEEEARLWRRLGKLLLDAGETAESYRVFRRGSSRCPSDGGLRHYARVYRAFHGDGGSAEEIDGVEEEKEEPPAAPLDGADLLRRNPDLLVPFDVPAESVPASVRDAAGGEKGGAPASSLTRLVYASAEPVLSADACRFVVRAAERAAVRRGGYTTDRHVHAPTCDVPAFELDGAAQGWIRSATRKSLLPLIALSFPPEMGVAEEGLRVQDCFVVRYDGSEEDPSGRGGEVGSGGFSSLRPHEDESLISLTVALNDMSEYEDGGLFIAATGDLLNGDAGTAMCFAGGLVHGGYPVQRGTRWILTLFLYVDRNASGRIPGYVLEKIFE